MVGCSNCQKEISNDEPYIKKPSANEERRKKVYLHVEIERNHQKEFASMIAAILGIIISFFDMYARTLPFEVSLFALGLIVVGFVGSFYYSHKKGQFERQLLELQFSVKCPSCKNPIPEGNLIFCPFCGTSLIRRQKCSKCGKSIPEGNFVFCPFCRASLPETKVTDS